MKRIKLSDTTITQLKPSSTESTFQDSELIAFILKVSPTGKRTFYCQMSLFMIITHF